MPNHQRLNLGLFVLHNSVDLRRCVRPGCAPNGVLDHDMNLGEAIAGRRRAAETVVREVADVQAWSHKEVVLSVRRRDEDAGREPPQAVFGGESSAIDADSPSTSLRNLGRAGPDFRDLNALKSCHWSVTGRRTRSWRP